MNFERNSSQPITLQKPPESISGFSMMKRKAEKQQAAGRTPTLQLVTSVIAAQG
jgi:hypothetical protein